MMIHEGVSINLNNEDTIFEEKKEATQADREDSVEERQE